MDFMFYISLNVHFFIRSLPNADKVAGFELFKICRKVILLFHGDVKVTFPHAHNLSKL